MVNTGLRWMMASLFFVLAAGSAEAAVSPTVLGFDDNSCPAWVRSKDDPEQRREYVSWMRGFLSGHNYANQKQQVSDVSRGTIEQYVERFCREKPKAAFIEAAYRMSDEYSGRGAPMTR